MNTCDYLLGFLSGALALYVYSEKTRKNVKKANRELREIEEKLEQLEEMNDKLEKEGNFYKYCLRNYR